MTLEFREESVGTRELYNEMESMFYNVWTVVHNNEELLDGKTTLCGAIENYYNLDFGITDDNKDVSKYIYDLGNLKNVLISLNTEYKNVVETEYDGEDSPLVNIPLPGKALFIALYTHYFCRLSTIPMEFTDDILRIASSTTTDGSYQFPFDIKTVGTKWVEPILFSRGWKTQPYAFSKNVVKEFPLVVDALEKPEVRNHLIHNIIKNRFYVKKWVKNEEIQAEISDMVERRDKVIKKMYGIRNKYMMLPGRTQRNIQRYLEGQMQNSNSQSLDLFVYNKIGNKFFHHISGGDEMSSEELLRIFSWLDLVERWVDEINNLIN